MVIINPGITRRQRQEKAIEGQPVPYSQYLKKIRNTRTIKVLIFEALFRSEEGKLVARTLVQLDKVLNLIPSTK